jgi:hypothetical protein
MIPLHEMMAFLREHRMGDRGDIPTYIYHIGRDGV